MTVTASTLRQNIYRLLDQVLETGEPLEISRNGQILKIVPPAPRSKLSGLPRREYMTEDPEELVHLDWSETWQP